MKRLIGISLFMVILPALCGAQVITFSDRGTFNAAVGPSTVETFTPASHFPITTGILNSDTDLVVANGTPILPGDIQPGVTYSRPIGPGFFFNIDEGGNFDGGFLDGFVESPNTPLTVTFDAPASAFGFDTNNNMGTDYTIDINDGNGGYVNTFSVANSTSMQFFGFADASPITSLTILGSSGGFFTFALDNFTFNVAPSGTPEPGPIGLLAGAVVGIGGMMWRRKRL